MLSLPSHDCAYVRIYGGELPFADAAPIQNVARRSPDDVAGVTGKYSDPVAAYTWEATLLVSHLGC